MHGLFGELYQQTLLAALRQENVRTYGLVRASHALAAPLPFVLYSDAYDHRAFVRGVAGSVTDQHYPGIDNPRYFGEFDYPMHKIPPSYLDQVLD